MVVTLDNQIEFVDLSSNLDRLCTSLQLCECLQTQDVAGIGTVDSMRKGIYSTRDKGSK